MIVTSVAASDVVFVATVRVLIIMSGCEYECHIPMTPS